MCCTLFIICVCFIYFVFIIVPCIHLCIVTKCSYFQLVYFAECHCALDCHAPRQPIRTLLDSYWSHLYTRPHVRTPLSLSWQLRAHGSANNPRYYIPHSRTPLISVRGHVNYPRYRIPRAHTQLILRRAPFPVTPDLINHFPVTRRQLRTRLY